MQQTPPPSDPFTAFITRDPLLLEDLDRLRTWSKTASDVLIVGEAGVGKSLLARLVHLASPRPNTAFIEYPPIDLPGVAHPWATPAATGDTLVLDGLERWSIARQTGLLEYLQRRVGLRLLVLSRVPAARLLDEGRLVPALAQHWGERAIAVPPLRARPDDIRPIVIAMLHRAGRSKVKLEPETWRAMSEHGWPDNVRELRQAIDAALAHGPDEPLTAAQLSLDPLAPPSLQALADGSFAELRRAVESWYLRRLVRQANGNLSEVARRAGSSRKVLRERLRRYGLYPTSSVLASIEESGSSAQDGGPLRWWGSPVRPLAEPRARHDHHAGVLQQALAQLRAGLDTAAGQRLAVVPNAGERVEPSRRVAAA